MPRWFCSLRVTQQHILLSAPEGDLLKARLDRSPCHPRALLTMSKAWAYGAGRRCALLCLWTSVASHGPVRISGPTSSGPWKISSYSSTSCAPSAKVEARNFCLASCNYDRPVLRVVAA
jgi:hypothetical protein